VLRAKELKIVKLCKKLKCKIKNLKSVAMGDLTKAYPTIPLSRDSELVRQYL
jgi:hypothetical protein